MRHRAPLFALLAVLVLGVGWWFLLYQPGSDDLAAVETETADLRARETVLRSEIAELERIRDDELTIRAELALMEEYIPNDVAQPMALRDLQEAADAAGVEIDTLAFGSPVALEEAPATGEPDTTLASIGVTMSVQGGYFQVVDLLRRLEVDVPRAVLVEEVSVSEEGETGFPTLLANWTGRMFAVVDVAATVAPEDGAPPGPDDDADGDADADTQGEDGGDADADAEDGATS